MVVAANLTLMRRGPARFKLPGVFYWKDGLHHGIKRGKLSECLRCDFSHVHHYDRSLRGSKSG